MDATTDNLREIPVKNWAPPGQFGDDPVVANTRSTPQSSANGMCPLVTGSGKQRIGI